MTTRKLLWLCLALALQGAVAWSQAPPDFAAASLSPAQNLVSNPSFEAQSAGRPSGFEFFTAPQYLHLTEEQALHGFHSLEADVPAGCSVETGARQDVPACPGCTYEFSAWVKIVEDRGGEARIGLQMRGPDGRVLAEDHAALKGADPNWRQLKVQLRAPQDTALVTIGAPSVLGGMRVFYDALRLHIVAGPGVRTSAPLVRELQAARVEPTWVLLSWEGPPGTYEVSYRRLSRPATDWLVANAKVEAFKYCVVELQAETTYQFRVRFNWRPFYDEQGQLAPAPVSPGETKPLTVKTAPWEARVAGPLRLWPQRHLDTYPGDQSAPQIVAWDKFLYVLENHQGAIQLSQLRPEDLAILWSHELIAARHNAEALQTLAGACVFADKLYVMYDSQETGRPDYRPTDSRAIVIVYDLHQDKLVGQTLAVCSLQPTIGTIGGGLAVHRQQVWALWSEIDAQQQTRLVLSPVTDNVLGEVHPWEAAPSTLVRNAALSVFADELIVTFTDASDCQDRPGYEPLSLVHFNGVDYHDLRKVSDWGRNKEARGAQLDDRFYLLSSTDGGYSSYGGRYRDLMLSILTTGGPTLETLDYANDMKYNCSPSLAAFGNSLYLVYEKLEQAPLDPASPPHCHGTFIGRLDLESNVPAAKH